MAGKLTLQMFLEENLPKEALSNIEAINRALIDASERYGRYAATRSKWKSYRVRRKLLDTILNRAEQLHSDLTRLDPITKDELEAIFGDQEVEKLQGHLSRLMVKRSDLIKSLQSTGRPRDLATWIWVSELADIYETNFKRRATISGSGSDERSSTRGKFYKLLELSQPTCFPRYGALHPKKLNAILSTRRSQSPR
jgi:hypothetical protein